METNLTVGINLWTCLFEDDALELCVILYAVFNILYSYKFTAVKSGRLSCKPISMCQISLLTVNVER